MLPRELEDDQETLQEEGQGQEEGLLSYYAT